MVFEAMAMAGTSCPYLGSIGKEAEETARQEKADLKASAKAKLIAGEALTEAEADTIVL